MLAGLILNNYFLEACGDYYHYINGTCYKKVGMLNYTQAKYMCTGNSSIPMVKSRYDEYALLQITKTMGGIWIHPDMSMDGYRYTNWYGMMSNTTDCVVLMGTYNMTTHMYNISWMVKDCMENHILVCAKDVY